VVSLEKGLTGLCVPSKTYGYMMQGLALLAIVGPSDIARDAQSGAGICVENGSGEALAEKIRALCDCVTEDNDHNGVGLALRRYLSSGKTLN
jgi:hypothetical protein